MLHLVAAVFPRPGHAVTSPQPLVAKDLRGSRLESCGKLFAAQSQGTPCPGTGHHTGRCAEGQGAHLQHPIPTLTPASGPPCPPLGVPPKDMPPQGPCSSAPVLGQEGKRRSLSLCWGCAAGTPQGAHSMKNSVLPHTSRGSPPHPTLGCPTAAPAAPRGTPSPWC